MARMVKRLSNLEIDEISLVDRPANQYGTVEITKADHQEDRMSVYDANGDEVFEEELQPGLFVYDDDGNQFVVAQDDDDDEGAGNAEYADDNEYADVGKAVSLSSLNSRIGPIATGRVAARLRVRGATNYVKARPARFAGGAGLAAGGAGGYYGGQAMNTSKSYGGQVLESLSKALNDSDRDQIIAGALDEMAEVAKRNEYLEEAIVGMQDDAELAEYYEVAKGYGIGDEEEIAGILYRASQTLPPEDLIALDRYFAGAGEIAKSYFDEVGYAGYPDADSVMGQVYSMANQSVAKNADLGLTQEQAVTAMFEANPTAYDEYEAEQRLR